MASDELRERAVDAICDLMDLLDAIADGPFLGAPVVAGGKPPAYPPRDPSKNAQTGPDQAKQAGIDPDRPIGGRRDGP